MDDRTWQTEYLLRSVPEKDQLIKETDIHYYDGCPYLNNPRIQMFALGVDPAYALGPKNDYTGMVAGALVGHGQDAKLYILPGVVIKRMTTDGLIAEIRRIVKGFPEFKRSKVYIEGSHGERGWATMLKTEKIEAEAVAAKDGKRNRLELYSHLISRGTILFPKNGAEELIKQLVYFKGVEHEDAADAYSLMVQCVAERYLGRSKGGMASANLKHFVITRPRPDGVICDPYLPPKEQREQLLKYYSWAKEQTDRENRVIQDMIDEGYDMRGA
jgi:predicted phage terminase large subunit-like protein